MVYLPDLRFGNKALNLTPKGQATKEKKEREREREKLNIIKIKEYPCIKRHVQENEKTTYIMGKRCKSYVRLSFHSLEHVF